MTNPVTNSGMPWWGIVIIIGVLLIVCGLIPWKRIFKKKVSDKELVDHDKEKQIAQKNKNKDKPIWGIYNGFGKKESLRSRTYIYVEEHEGSCELCRQFENKIIAVDTYSKNTPTMREAIAKGYHHIGCTHVDKDYYHEVTKLSKNKWSDEDQALRHAIKLQQFRFEDDIRKLKYDIEESVDDAEVESLHKKLSKLENTYQDFLNKNNVERRIDKEDPDIPDYEKFA